jgi:hypothetical protein
MTRFDTLDLATDETAVKDLLGRMVAAWRLTAQSGLPRSRGMGAEQPERARRGEFDKEDSLASRVLHDLDVRGKVWGALRAQESKH